MGYAFRTSNGPVEIVVAPTITDGNGVQFSFETMMLWDDDTRAVHGIFPIVDPQVPDGQYIASSTLADDGTTISRNAVFAPIPCPKSVTNYQARSVLIRNQLFTSINNAMKNMDMNDIDNQIAFNAWEYANDFLRNDPVIAKMQGLLKLKDSDVDALFIAASKIGVE